MGFLDVFCAAYMPVKVLIITALEAFLALESINILGDIIKKQLNEVSFSFASSSSSDSTHQNGLFYKIKYYVASGQNRFNQNWVHDQMVMG
ncbi:hypothetical protein Hanom_Chr06g00549291 [Helianthus anomalus]